MSHDKITRFLSEEDFASEDLWKLETGKTLRKSDKNKNEVMRAQLKACAHDLRIKLSFVLAGNWFSSYEC